MQQKQDRDTAAAVTLAPRLARLHPADLRRAVEEGQQCVQFMWCVSAVAATFRFQSPAYLTDSWQTRYLRGIPYSLLSLALGLWGVPWGLIVTGRAVWTNLSGGLNVTAQVLSQLDRSAAESGPGEAAKMG